MTASPRPGRVAPAWLPLLLVLLLAGYPLLRDLGGPLLWEDEGDTAVFARNIARFGLPLAWDGRSFTDSDYGARVAPRLFGADFVLVGTPWVPFYATAASFALLGESTRNARLPFALAGLACVALLYLLVRRATGDPQAALAGALLLPLSVQFLLYARECRHYALNMALTLALLLAFLRLGERRRDPMLVIVAVLLFYTQILPLAAALAACGGLTLLHPAFRSLRRPFWVRVPWIAALTAPWLPVSWTAFGANWDLNLDPRVFVRALAQFSIELSTVAPLLGLVIGAFLLRRRLSARDRQWLALAGALFASCAILAALTQTRARLTAVGLRYECGLLPVAAGAAGLLVARASRGRPFAFAAGIALLGATHLAGNALPWLAVGESRALFGGWLSMNAPRELADKLVNRLWWDFVSGLGVPNPGTASELAEFLRGRAEPGQVLVTNYSWDNLYFYTDLPQGMRLPPGAPLHEAALAAGLPGYVVGLDGADWLVWRNAAEPILGKYPLDRVRSELEARGARVEPLASFRETLWENRPELAAHRFPRVGYPFAPARLGAGGRHYPDAEVFRIHWR